MIRQIRALTAGFAISTVFCSVAAAADAQPAARTAGQPENRRVKRVLLLGQSPDGHPWSTHEYMAGMRILAQCLQPVENLQTLVAGADEPWSEGPELLEGADGVVLFLSEGAKWLHQDPARLAAFRRLAKRGGGCAVLHWGMGCREARYIEGFVNLFGGCHGGPDRKFKVVTVDAELPAPDHPVTKGIPGGFRVREEFYYTLKFPKEARNHLPLVRVPIDGETHTVGWAWERPDGGRSFGFSGGHFHENWQLEEYRRLMTQGILWTLKMRPPERLPLKISQQDLDHPRPKPPEEP